MLHAKLESLVHSTNEKLSNISSKFVNIKFDFIIEALLQYFDVLVRVCQNEYIADIFWTGVELMVALSILITFSLATFFITVIVNLNEMLKQEFNEVIQQKEQDLGHGDESIIEVKS
ncbi:hypothetical protein CBL_04459 [Carabus blaptoides fortunei]